MTSSGPLNLKDPLQLDGPKYSKLFQISLKGIFFCLSTLEICFYVVMVEELSWSNNSESDTVGSSKLLFCHPWWQSWRQRLGVTNPQSPMVQQADDNDNRSHQLNQRMKADMHDRNATEDTAQNYNWVSGSLLQFHNWILHITFPTCHRERS